MARTRDHVGEDLLQEIARLARAEVPVTRIAKITGLSEFKVRTRLNDALEAHPPINHALVECAWPKCEQRAMATGAVCYFHKKRSEGLV